MTEFGESFFFAGELARLKSRRESAVGLVDRKMCERQMAFVVSVESVDGKCVKDK